MMNPSGYHISIEGPGAPRLRLCRAAIRRLLQPVLHRVPYSHDILFALAPRAGNFLIGWGT